MAASEQRTGERGRPVREGDYAEHIMSGWAGTVLTIEGEGEGALVTVRPTHPRPKEVWVDGHRKGEGGFVPTPDRWTGWNPITVSAGELAVRDLSEGD